MQWRSVTGRNQLWKPSASVLATDVTDRSPFSIIPIGSLHTGWALKVDGVLRREPRV